MQAATDATVSLAEIARIADVGRAAVSNWRRRHPSFPLPVGGSDTSPQFSLVEVEEWLRAEGKVRAVDPASRLWPYFEALSDRAVVGEAIASFALREFSGELAPRTATVAESAIAMATGLAQTIGAESVFNILLARWTETYRQNNPIPSELAKLMATIGGEILAGRSQPQHLSVYDPACGTGELLLAASRSLVSRWGRSVSLVGSDRDPVMVPLAQTRLELETLPVGRTDDAFMIDIRSGNSLLNDPHRGVRADLLLCDVPFNERDWGYQDLATDSRWAYGLPPRTESELAWIEHALARLRPGGVGILLVPPAVASRRAGRRIRSGLVRSGALRGVIALPTGAAPPNSISLHLWIVQVPIEDGGASVFLCDARGHGGQERSTESHDMGPGPYGDIISAVRQYDWGPTADHRQQFIQSAVAASVPAVDLLDDDVDLTPARHMATLSEAPGPQLDERWADLGKLSLQLQTKSETLAAIGLDDRPEIARATIGDLTRARAIRLIAGAALPDAVQRGGAVPDGAHEVISVARLLTEDGDRVWLAPEDLVSGASGSEPLVLAMQHDVIVVAVERVYRVWVHLGPPLVIGPQIFALRLDHSLLDPWFLAGCLRAPSGIRAASSHTSTSARVDVRKLEVPQLPLDDQERYGLVLRDIEEFGTLVKRFAIEGDILTRALYDRLAAGRLRVK